MSGLDFVLFYLIAFVGGVKVGVIAMIYVGRRARYQGQVK